MDNPYCTLFIFSTRFIKASATTVTRKISVTIKFCNDSEYWEQVGLENLFLSHCTVHVGVFQHIWDKSMLLSSLYIIYLLIAYDDNAVKV